MDFGRIEEKPKHCRSCVVCGRSNACDEARMAVYECVNDDSVLDETYY